MDSWLSGSLCRCCGCGFGRHVSVACPLFVFLLLGQDRLEHVARLGDMREVDFGRYALGSTR